MIQRQWCVVRGCVALADSPHVPFLCRIHGTMTRAERDAWSREHSFQKWDLQRVITRLEYER